MTNSFAGTFYQVQAVSASTTVITVEVRTSAGVIVASTAGIPVHFDLRY